jgi:Mrp family chromosome partitioning ATPase
MAAKTNVGIISLDDTKKTVEEQIAKIQGKLLDVGEELAIHQGVLDNTNSPSPGNPSATNALAVAQIPSDQIDAYSKASLRLVILEKKKGEFLAQGYAEGGVLDKDLADQIATIKAVKTSLEAKYPGLAGLGASVISPDEQAEISPDESAKLSELKSTVTVLNTQLDQLRQEAVTIGLAAPKINDLERKQQIEEQNLSYFLKSLDDARINEALGAGKISGIKSIQEPTPPSLAETKRVKISGMLAGGGIALALALAFLIEFYLDRSVKRPAEIENKLKMPLFLSIPDVIRNGKHQRAVQRQLRMKNDEDVATGGNLQLAPWSPNHSLRGFYEALRDRIVVHFEVRNITRNPKLVAVTSANRGAGVTSIAMGLAASLSETGEGNVLLVDMNAEQGAVQQFYKGKPGCPLDDAFVSEKRNGALVQNNLYVVSDRSGADKLPRIMPKRFSSLLPKFKASDYDYIIFDMPPVTQTSVTPRLAGHMDMVLLVVEAEKTKQEVVRRANSLLAESKANVIAVLNKAHQYVPEKLHQEFLSDG